MSVTVIALNQEANIGDCLASVSFADEIVVVDTGSTDGTVEIARAYTDRIIAADWQGFAATKNLALDQARMDWVFSLDTDERVAPVLKEEILAVVAGDGPLTGYRVARKNYFGGRWIKHLGWYPDYTLRLFRRSQGRFAQREVHEEVTVDGPVGYLKNPLEHYSYRDLADYATRQERYAALAARELVKQGRRPRSGELLIRPFLTFLKLYLWRRGFLEGRLGLNLAYHGSRYNFLKYRYLRQMRRKPQPHDH